MHRNTQTILYTLFWNSIIDGIGLLLLVLFLLIHAWLFQYWLRRINGFIEFRTRLAFDMIVLLHICEYHPSLENTLDNLITIQYFYWLNPWKCGQWLQTDYVGNILQVVIKNECEYEYIFKNNLCSNSQSEEMIHFLIFIRHQLSLLTLWILQQCK